MLIKKYVLVFAFIFLSSSSSFASEIYYIDFSGNQSTESIYLDAASKYYGIEIVHCSREDTCLNGISSALTRNSIDGVILAANSLSGINYIKFSKLFKEGMKKIPVMIFGISPGNNEEIKLWSNDSIRNVESISTQPLQSYYLFSEDKSISRQLSGLSLINKSRVVNVFNVKNSFLLGSSDFITKVIGYFWSFSISRKYFFYLKSQTIIQTIFMTIEYQKKIFMK